jgi:hypothetical protein
MADIFLSYSRADRAIAERLARELEEEGWTVWWDWQIRAGDRFDSVMTGALEGARCVVVVWSESSARSESVNEEVHGAARQGLVLFPILTTRGLPLPYEFRHLQAPILDEQGIESVLSQMKGFLKGAGGVAEEVGLSDEAESSAPAAPKGPAADPISLAVSSPGVLSPTWSTVRTYFFDGSGRRDVEADAKALRHKEGEDQSFTDAAGIGVPAGTKITVTLTVPDGECIPERRHFTWAEHWRKEDFAVRYAGTLREEGSEGEGLATWFAGPLCLGEVPFQFAYSARRVSAAARKEPSFGRGFESVFLSYAHKDSFIADWIESANALGIRYLRDTRDLRSGEVWNERLKELIQEADLFQLCWSDFAKQSQFVREEWCYALGLNKPKFVRPCYWDDPMAPPPNELEKLHFQKLHPDWLTRMRFRIKHLFGG